MHCEEILKLRSHYTSYCLIEVVNKIGPDNSGGH
jgi:hypothetical protein